MKLSCLPVSFFQDLLSGRMTILEWANLGEEEGLDAIDLSAMLIAQHTPAYLEQLKADLAGTGMPLTMITTYSDFTHPDAGQRQREMEYARFDIALSAQLGARYLRVLAGQAYPGTECAQGIQWVTESFKWLDEVAVRHGVQLLFENHSSPGSWRFTDFSHPPEIFLEIC